MKLIALKECPQGQLPGQVFDAPDAHAEVLILVGAARKATETEADPPRRSSYRRRNLVAES